MNFGKAIEALKQGKKVTRKGWNGKKMFLWLKPATQLKSDFLRDPILKQTVEDNGGTMDALGTICMKTADNRILTGWLASQTDMLSDDWEIVGGCEGKQPVEMEQNKMGEDIGSILSDIEKWADGDKENRAFILIATDKNIEDKENNAQTVFHMQGDEGVNAFAVSKILANKGCKQFKTMMATCLIMDRMVGGIFK